MTEEGNLCAICLSDLDGEETYKIDCSHVFHTKCIIEWFRKSKGNCPLCNDNPTSDNSNVHYVSTYRTLLQERYILIQRKFGRRKDCPPELSLIHI